MMRHIDTLSLPLRSVVLLHYLEQFTLCETAKALEVPVGTVKSRLAAALSALRERLRLSPETP
jgi:RNA polymerase sigma-70 factor (ECF subfamily)